MDRRNTSDCIMPRKVDENRENRVSHCSSHLSNRSGRRLGYARYEKLGFTLYSWENERVCALCLASNACAILAWRRTHEA